MIAKHLLLFCLLFSYAMFVRNDLEWEKKTGCSKSCEICSPTFNICQRCASGLYYSTTIEQCTPGSINNCKYFIASSVCSECNQGYTIQKGGCVPCLVANCRNCNSLINGCDECYSSHTSSAVGLVNCDLQCLVQNCEKCAPGNSNSCQKCQNGFRLSAPNVCQKCAVLNCINCDADVNICTAVPSGSTKKSCDLKYYLDKNVCVDCGKGCKECDINGICLSCDTVKGYFMHRDMTCKFRDILGLYLLGTLVIWLI